jgi:hypothetical protein
MSTGMIDLRAVPFPDGYGASVHFFWPGKGFQLLGMLVLLSIGPSLFTYWRPDFPTTNLLLFSACEVHLHRLPLARPLHTMRSHLDCRTQIPPQT